MTKPIVTVNIPRHLGLLRAVPERENLEPIAGRWWVWDDTGPIDGPHETCEAAWDRVIELQPRYPAVKLLTPPKTKP
jgi:hypothetical protein